MSKEHAIYHYDFSRENGKLTIFLLGELTEENLVDTRKRLDYIIEDHFDIPFEFPNKFAILDVSQLTKVDEDIFIGMLLGRYKKASKLGITLFIQNPTPEIKKVLDYSGVHSLIPEYEEA